MLSETGSVRPGSAVQTESLVVGVGLEASGNGPIGTPHDHIESYSGGGLLQSKKCVHVRDGATPGGFTADRRQRHDSVVPMCVGPSPPVTLVHRYGHGRGVRET